MRKSIDTLAILVAEQMALDPLSGHLFAFCNRRRDTVQILCWDRNGFCLYHKRLERDRFRWPDNATEVRRIGLRELRWLLEGLSLVQPAHGQKDAGTTAGCKDRAAPPTAPTNYGNGSWLNPVVRGLWLTLRSLEMA